MARLSRLQSFKVDRIFASRYRYLKLPGTFPHKFIPDIDFKDEAVVQCNVSVIKIPLQMLAIFNDQKTV